MVARNVRATDRRVSVAERTISSPPSWPIWRGSGGYGDYQSGRHWLFCLFRRLFAADWPHKGLSCLFPRQSRWPGVPTRHIALLGQKLGVCRALLSDHLSPQYFITIDNGRQTMGDDKSGTALRDGIQAV